MFDEQMTAFVASFEEEQRQVEAVRMLKLDSAAFASATALAAFVEEERKHAELIRSFRFDDVALVSATSFATVTESMAEAARLREHFARLAQGAEQVRAAFASQVGAWESAARQMAEEQRWWESLPPKLKWAHTLIGRIGWYPDDDMAVDQPMELAAAIEAGEIEEVETFFEQYYDEKLATIEASQAELFPSRGLILRKAFAAHRSGDFELSVPVFLAQADGICYERCGEKLFGRVPGTGKPRTAKYVEQVVTNAFQEATLYFLSEPLPISASPRSAKFDERALNRHSVLHGTSIDYGTKRNSLKAIALLQYLAVTLVHTLSQVAAAGNDSNGSAV